MPDMRLVAIGATRLRKATAQLKQSAHFLPAPPNPPLTTWNCRASFERGGGGREGSET